MLRASTDVLRQSAIDLLAQELDAGTTRSEQWLQWLVPWILDTDDATARGRLANPSSAELDAALSALLLADSAPAGTGKPGADAIDFALLERLARAVGGPHAVIVDNALDTDALRSLAQPGRPVLALLQGRNRALRLRSEERRVGKEGGSQVRSRWSRDH